MSASGMRILLMIALCGLVSLASAQENGLTDAELESLVIWYPQEKSFAGPGLDRPNSYVAPNSYEDLAELVDRKDKNAPVQSLRVTIEVLKKGNVSRLAELKELRVLNLEVDSLTAKSSLWQTVSQLKQLQRLTIHQRFFGSNFLPFSLSLPSSLQQLKVLDRLDVMIASHENEQTFTTLAGMPALRKLTVWVNGNPAVLPTGITKLQQITSLRVQNGQYQLQIPPTLGELKNLRELDFSYQRIDAKTDWSFLSRLTDLETLRLANTNLTVLPDLRKLTRLETIDLQGNRQLTITEGIFSELNTLEKINLDNCNLRKFPMALVQLGSLKQLTINNNPLGELPPQIGLLKQLNVLQANGCQLNKLPESMDELVRLKSLGLSGNQLDTLNFDLGKLSGLVSLSIFNNQLRYLPASIGQLARLDQLNLSGNRLVRLPESMGDLIYLTSLSLSMNQLTELPKNIGKLVKINRLDVGQNQLQRIPNEIGQLWQLRQLTLNDNKLTQLPEGLGKLDSLHGINLQKNQFTVFPEVLFRLKKLLDLNLNENKLSSIPAGLGALSRLRNLTITHNQLPTLPAELGKLTHLHHLILDGNPLAQLPETIGNCRELELFFARNTKLTVLPEGITQLAKLQMIDLSGNELTILPASLGNLAELRNLQLGRTRLVTLPESIGRLTRLTNLQVGEMEEDTPKENSGLRQLPDSIVYCRELNSLQLMNQPSLDGEDVFTKISRLPKLRNLTLFHCNIDRIPSVDWKSLQLHQLSLMRNRLSELPVELLEAPQLNQISLYDNLLPQPLNTNFSSKDALRLAFSEAGLLPLEKIAKPNRNVANAFVQAAFQKARERNWSGAFVDLEKAIEYGSDTMRIVTYAQRADMHTFRQEYPEAIADYDQSIRLSSQLSKGVPEQALQKQQFEQPAVLALRGRANAKAKLGQIDAASADIELALRKLNSFKGDPQLTSNLLTEQGRYFTLSNKLREASLSYRKAIEEYEKLPYANPGSKLTIVELHLIVGQPDQARMALQRIDKRELTGGFAILERYLENSIQILKSEKPDAEILKDLTTFLASHNERIFGWSFELYENWLSRSGLPTEKQTVLRQLTQLTKERLPKMD
ncbi:leucine-rich repeat domain-containing protein [Larkinella rosea]|uniref:Disease resistance R13L4/SHOC-2-like LRR domain-containing protein n=1 Tax=Larkinella rosea TaxID=2025312 RepID=A0A3P1C111_9BACT|nr:leucine-rich repeat domain-containing protein [Larkinella rosea]RRB06474.1 hypothetical protein EHT25_01345 [Larkinella rosea]